MKSRILIDLPGVEQLTGVRYVIDWVHGYCDMPYVDKLFKGLAAIDDRLSFDKFERWKVGFRNYTMRYCLNGTGIIQICYCPRHPDEELPDDYLSTPDNTGALATMRTGKAGYGGNRGVFISISGDGCRYIGDDNFQAVMQLLYSLNFKCSRLDVSCDIFDKDNDVIPLLQKAFDNAWRRKPITPGEPTVKSKCTRNHLKPTFNIDQIRYSDKPEVIVNWTWGHYQSSCCEFRLYDKWLEVSTVPRLKSVKDEMLKPLKDDYWWRFEYSMHKDYANTLFTLIASDSMTVPMAFAWCADRVFTPIEGREFNTQTSRLDVYQVWKDFIALASTYIPTIHFVSKYYETSVDRREQYIYHVAPLIYGIIRHLEHNSKLREVVYDEGCRKFFANKRNSVLIESLDISHLSPQSSAIVPYSSLYEQMTFFEV